MYRDVSGCSGFNKVRRVRLLVFFFLFWTPVADAQTLVLHSSLPADVTDALTGAFGQQTRSGPTVVKESTQRTAERVLTNENFNGDVILSADAPGLLSLAEAGSLAPNRSGAIHLPGYLNGPRGLWQAISARARLILYNEKLIAGDPPAGYRDLADPAYRGAICVSSGHQAGNITLAANSMARMGRRSTAAWLAGMKANFASEPAASDFDQLQALKNGECGISLIASDTYLRLLNSSRAGERALVDGLAVMVPDQPNLDFTFAAILASSKNPALAEQFIDFLTRETAQRILARIYYQIPAIDAYHDEPALAILGRSVALSTNTFPASREAYDAARELLARIGWD